MNTPSYTDPGQPGAPRAPSPPSGPEAKTYGPDDGAPERFREFMESAEGKQAMEKMAEDALRALDRGETRFSVRAWIDTQKVAINNAFCPRFADELVKRYPRLVDIVERRVRKAVATT